MKCPACHHRFAVNWQVDCAPGGQESPGTFLIVGSLFFVPAIACFIWSAALVGYLLLGLTGFVWLQTLVAWSDCFGTWCPECKTKVRVWPWSL